MIFHQGYSIKKYTGDSPGDGVRFFHPCLFTLHTGWKQVFWKASYIRTNKKFVSMETKFLNMEKNDAF